MLPIKTINPHVPISFHAGTLKLLGSVSGYIISPIEYSVPESKELTIHWSATHGTLELTACDMDTHTDEYILLRRTTYSDNLVRYNDTVCLPVGEYALVMTTYEPEDPGVKGYIVVESFRLGSNCFRSDTNRGSIYCDTFSYNSRITVCESTYNNYKIKLN